MFDTSSDDDYKPSLMERMGAAVVKMGPMPKHIAIILDGNRRFARKMKLGSVTDGHKSGATKVHHVIDMLLELGIGELSVYAFSIENFKRAQEEVAGIMELLAKKVEVTDANIGRSKEKGSCIEFVGNIEDTPSAKLRNTLEQNMLLTKDNKKIKINVCFIYTGRNEITKGVNNLVNGLTRGNLRTENVSEKLLQETFNLHPSNPVDILLRTSGESRLSDFILWGCSDAYLEFVDETWPEYQFWGLLLTIFRYQHQIMFRGLKNNNHSKIDTEENQLKPDAEKFVNELRERRWNQMGIAPSS